MPIVIRSTKILLQHVPKTINLETIKNKILKIRDVNAIHEFHIWQLDSERIIGTMHITINSNMNNETFMTLCNTIKVLMHNHGIHNTTIQPEFVLDSNIKCFEPICQQQCHAKHCC